MSFQAVTVMVQGLLTFTLGLVIVGHGSLGRAAALRQTLRLPFLYVIAAALVLKHFGVPITRWAIVWMPIKNAADGLVAVALLTLGVQIAKTPRVRHGGALSVAVVARLMIAPVAAFFLVRIFGITGMLSKLLVIAAAGPSAVSTVLLSLELRNRPEFAASAVFYTTVCSAVTVATTIFLVRNLM